MNFYKRYCGDYLRDTAHLSLAQHGAYCVLLDHLYSTEKPIKEPSDFYRITRAVSKEEKRAVDRVREQFFAQTADGWIQKRAFEEIGKLKKFSDIVRENGKAGGRPVKQKPDENQSGSDNQTASKPARFQNRSPTRTRTKPDWKANQTPDLLEGVTELTPEGVNSSTPLSAAKLPDCPHREILALFAKHLPMLLQPRVWEGTRAKALQTRWRQCARANGLSHGYQTVEDGLSFWEKFFRYVANTPKLVEGIPRKDGGIWRPDLPWLLKAENFAKVIEGRYES